jgi:hypothetical protein
MAWQDVACCWGWGEDKGLQGAPTAGQVHEGYTSLPSPGRWTRMPARMGMAAGARRSLDKDAANRQASFLFLGPFSSCVMADQQKQTGLHA